MWNRNKVREGKKPSKNLLETAFTLLNSKVRRPLLDRGGKYAYETEKGILVAKDKPYGNLVSCTARAVLIAKNRELPLLMYIAQNDTIYEFNVDEILKLDDVNERIMTKNGKKIKIKMLNFGLRNGRKLE